jgi:hypothetical protein
MWKRVLIASVLLTGCGSFTPHGPADARLTAFIPGDTVVLAGVRVAELRQTALYKDVEPLLGPIAREGFDPRRDVEEVLIASNGKHTAAMARGSFSITELERLPRSTYRGVALFGDGQGAVAWIDSKTVVAGTTPAVRAAIDQQKSGSRAGADLLSTARGLPSPNQVWMVSKGSPTFLRAPEMPNAEVLEKMLHAMSDVQFFADLRNGIYAELAGQAANETDAKFLGDTARGLTGLARLAVPRSEAQLAQVLDGIRVTQSRRALTVQAKVAPEVAARAMERIRSLSRRRPRESMPRPH